jgi:C4-dicarboxylate transporter/malic acid transport protein
MGLGALSVALKISGNFLDWSVFGSLALAFTVLTGVLTAVFTVPWLLRFLKYPGQIRKDLSHPIRSQFFPTMPISLILVGIGLQRTFTVFPGLVQQASIGLFFLGSAGIFSFGVALSKILFTNTNIETKHGVFAWFIPPVSHIIVPVLGFMLLSSGLSGVLADAVYLISLSGLGIGTFMFLFLTPVILHRYAYEDLPDTELAPTFLIGIAPTAVLIITAENMIKLAETGFIHVGETIIPVLELLIGLMWGFSAWWFLLTAAIVVHYIRTDEHPFEFTWWAYTFPLGAFAIATGITSKTFQITALETVTATLTLLLAGVITFNTYKTARMIKQGEAFPLS